MFSWEKTSKPILALAPMAGYTDSSYRQLIKELAPQAIVFSEFTNSEAIYSGKAKSKRMLEFQPSEQPFIGQIFGNKPVHFVEAAQWIESIGAAGVDINMGCPAKKIVSSDHGSALLNDPQRAEDIVKQTANAISIPLSVKMRLGVTDATNSVDFAKRMEGAGAQMLTFHGRTAKQMYTSQVDFESIYAIKSAVSVPVIGNGDIVSVDCWQQRLQTLDGLMIGRGTIGNPWLMAELAGEIQNANYNVPRSFADKIPIILRHAELVVERKGELRGCREMRKFFAGYVRTLPNVREFRQRLVRVERLQEAREIFAQLLDVIPESHLLDSNPPP